MKVLADGSATPAMITVIGIVVGIFASMVPLVVSAKHGFSMGAWVTLAPMALAAFVVVSIARGLIQRDRHKMRARVGGLMDRIVTTSEGGVTQEESTLSVESLSAAHRPSDPVAEALREKLTS